MSRRKLDPLEFNDFSAGLNKFAGPQLIQTNELSLSENIRHLGAGRMIRRGGMKTFSANQITPANTSASVRYGRLIAAYIRKITLTANKRALVEPVSLINNLLYRCLDGVAAETIKLKDDNPSFAYTNAQAQLPWKPYDTRNGTKQYETHAPMVGKTFLDNRIYLGTPHTDAFFNQVRANYPCGVLLWVVASAAFTVGTTIVGGASAAQGVIGNKSDTDNALFLYNWNGKPFTDGETVAVGGTSTKLNYSSEFAPGGFVLDHLFGASDKWTARKWGITHPWATLTATADNGSGGSVNVGTYQVIYTFIRYIGGSIAAGDNQKLTGGELVSESPPSAAQAVVQTVTGKKILYNAWEISPDPQATHVRIYRKAANASNYVHVGDVALNGMNLTDNLAIADLDLLGVLNYTDGLKAFGEDGEYSGSIIESANHRIFLAGNATYPNRIYISPDSNLHYLSELFDPLSGVDITESPGESITALKWWNENLYVFMERSIYKIYVATTDLGTSLAHKLVTRGIGCSARNGVLDMGDYLLIMSEAGLVRFNGSTFDQIPLTLKFDELLGTNLQNAIITKSDTHIYIITETSRALNYILTVKYRDGSFALGVDKLNTAITMPEALDYIPELNNFGNTVDDSNCLVGLFRNPNDTGATITYRHAKYDLASSDLDYLFVTTGDPTEYTIIAKFSPKILDFGGFAEACLEEISAHITSCGNTSATEKAPTGEWKARMFINEGNDDTAERYDEVLLRPKFKRKISLVRTTGDPPAPKYTEIFSGTQKTQSGGVYGSEGEANALLGDVKQIIFKGKPSGMVQGRIWRFQFEYSSVKNFEFTSVAFKFVREED